MARIRGRFNPNRRPGPEPVRPTWADKDLSLGSPGGDYSSLLPDPGVLVERPFDEGMSSFVSNLQHSSNQNQLPSKAAELYTPWEGSSPYVPAGPPALPDPGVQIQWQNPQYSGLHAQKQAAMDYLTTPGNVTVEVQNTWEAYTLPAINKMLDDLEAFLLKPKQLGPRPWDAANEQLY